MRFLGQVWRTIATELDSDVPEAFFHGSFDAAFELFKVAAAAMGIAVGSEPAFTAKELIDGHVCTFTFNVPECLIEAAQGVIEDRAVAPIGACIGVLPHVFYVVNVSAFGEGIEVFINGDGCRQRALIEGGASEAVKARLGSFDFDDAEAYSLGGGKDGFYVGYF